MKNKRRKFLKKASLVSVGLLTVNETLQGSPNKLSAKSYSKVIGANDRINIAFQGLGRRLPGLLKSSVKLNNVDILYFCDVMKKQMTRANKQFNDLTGLSAKTEVDIHKILDDTNVYNWKSFEPLIYGKIDGYVTSSAETTNAHRNAHQYPLIQIDPGADIVDSNALLSAKV